MTYPVAIAVIFAGSALLGSCIVGVDLTQYIRRVCREYARLVVWFSDTLAALSIRVMIIYDRKRPTGVIIAQLMHM